MKSLQSLHSLNNFTGTFCSIVGKKHLIAFYDDSPILIHINQMFYTSNQVETLCQYKEDLYKNLPGLEFFLRMSNIVWLNGIPILLEKIEDGMKLKFDAIFISKVGYQVILMWTGTKPQSLPILNANELLIVKEYFNIPVHCITFENGDPFAYVYLDGCAMKLPISFKIVTINEDELKSNEEIRKVCSIIHPSNSVAKISKLICANLSNKYLYICNKIYLGKSKVENTYESKLQFGQVYKANSLYKLILHENCWRIYFDIKLELNYFNNEHFLCFNINNKDIQLKYSELLNFEFKDKSAFGKGHLVFVKNQNGTSYWHVIIFEMMEKNHETNEILNFPSLITLKEDELLNCPVSDLSGNEKMENSEIVNKCSDFIGNKVKVNENFNGILKLPEESLQKKCHVSCGSSKPLCNSINQVIHESTSNIDYNSLLDVANKFMVEIETNSSKVSSTMKNIDKQNIELSKYAKKSSSISLNKKVISSTALVSLTGFCKEMYCQKNQGHESQEFYSFEKYFLTNNIGLEDLYLSVEQFGPPDIFIIEKHLVQTLLEDVDVFPQHIKKGCGKFFSKICSKELKINFIVCKLFGHWIIILTNSFTMYFCNEILSQSETGQIRNGTDVFFDAAFHNGNICYIALVVYDCVPPNTALCCLEHYYYFNIEGIYRGESNGCVLVDLCNNDSSSVEAITMHLQIKNKEDLIFFQRLNIKEDLKIYINLMEIAATVEFKVLFFSPFEATVSFTKGIENIHENDIPDLLCDRTLRYKQNEEPYLLRDHIATVSKVDSTVTLSITFPNGIKLLQNISKDHMVYINKSWVCANTLAAQSIVRFDGIVSNDVIGLFLLIWVSVRPEEKLGTYCTKYFGLPGIISSINKNSLVIDIFGLCSKLSLPDIVVPVDKNPMIFDHRGVAYKKHLKVNEVVLIYFNKYVFHNYRKNVCLAILMLHSSVAKLYLPLYKEDQINPIKKSDPIVIKDPFIENFGACKPRLEMSKFHKISDSSNKVDAISMLVNDKDVECSELSKATAISNNGKIADLNLVKGGSLPDLKDIGLSKAAVILNNNKITASNEINDASLPNLKDKGLSKAAVISNNNKITASNEMNGASLPNLKDKVLSKAAVISNNNKVTVSNEMNGASLPNLKDKGLSKVVVISNNNKIIASNKMNGASLPNLKDKGLRKMIAVSNNSKISASNDLKDALLPELKDKIVNVTEFYYNCSLIFEASRFAILTAAKNLILLCKDDFCYSTTSTPRSTIKIFNTKTYLNAFVVVLQKPINFGTVIFTHRALVAWQGPKSTTVTNVNLLFMSRYPTFNENSVSEEALLCDKKLKNYLITLSKDSKQCPTPAGKSEVSFVNNNIMSYETANNEKSVFHQFMSSGLVSTGISSQSDSSKMVISRGIKAIKLPENSKIGMKKVFLTCKLIFVGSQFAILTASLKFIILLKKNFCKSLNFATLCFDRNVNTFSVCLQKPTIVGQMTFTHRAIVAWQGTKDSTLENVDSLFYSRSLSYSESLLTEKDVSFDGMLMNYIFNIFGKGSQNVPETNLNFTSNKDTVAITSNKDTVAITSNKDTVAIISNKDTVTIPNVIISSMCNKLHGSYVSRLHTFKLSKGELKLNVYNITGYVIVASALEGIMKMTNSSDSRVIYFYFEKKVCFIDGKKMANTTNIEFTKVLNKIKSTSMSVNAEVYECKKEKKFGIEFCYCVAILWNVKKPRNEDYTILKEPACNSNDFCHQKETSKRNNKNKAPSSMKISSLDKQVSPAKVKQVSVSSFSSESSKKRKEQINEVKSNESSLTFLQSDLPNPIAPVTSRKAVDLKLYAKQDNKIPYLVGMLMAVDEAFGKVEDPNKVLYSFTREKCFLYGISLYNLSLKDVVKKGCVVEFQIDEYKSVSELWIGIPQISEELTYSCVLQWCIQHSVSLIVKSKLLSAIDYIPSDCDPQIKPASECEIVTL